MTPQERREALKKRFDALNMADYRMVRESGFTGFRGYLDGKKACDENIYKLEQALTRLESNK